MQFRDKIALLSFLFRRPETSFLWFQSPLRSLKLIWRKTKWYIIGTIFLISFIIFLLLFLWAMPVRIFVRTRLSFKSFSHFSQLFGHDCYTLPGDCIYSRNSIIFIKNLFYLFALFPVFSFANKDFRFFFSETQTFTQRRRREKNKRDY